MEWKANVSFKAQDSDVTGKVTGHPCHTCPMFHWTGGLTQKYGIYGRGDAWGKRTVVGVNQQQYPAAMHF